MRKLKVLLTMLATTVLSPAAQASPSSQADGLKAAGPLPSEAALGILREKLDGLSSRTIFAEDKAFARFPDKLSNSGGAFQKFSHIRPGDIRRSPYERWK